MSFQWLFLEAGAQGLGKMFSAAQLDGEAVDDTALGPPESLFNGSTTYLVAGPASSKEHGISPAVSNNSAASPGAAASSETRP
jgi:hypothetical protein